MIKTFELIHKALLILAFWSIVLLFVYFSHGSLEESWTRVIINYVTAIVACSAIFLSACLFFFLIYKFDAKKKEKEFVKTEIDGFECNVGQPFRRTKKPKQTIKCEALDLHSIYFKAGVLYKEAEKKEEAELKRNEDNEKIADLLAEKLVLMNEFKNIQTLLANQEYSKQQIAKIKDKNSISKHEEIELANFQANVDANSEEEIRDRISKIKEGLNDIERKISEVNNSTPTAEGEDNTEEVVENIINKMNKEGDSGYTMYGGDDVDFEQYKEHNKKGLLYYRDAFEQLYSSLSAEKRIVVDTNIANLMEALPNFAYEGVVSSTPMIKKMDGFDIDLQSYQLSIFTAFFPIMTWLEMRETECLVGLNLRDKRMLWTAKRTYDIYVKRDADLKANRPSAYSLPLKSYKGSFRLPHEEIGCLVELWRFVEKAKLIEDKSTVHKKVTSNISNHDLIQLVRDLISQEDRINGGNRDKRVGFWYDNKIFLEWEKFMVEARLMFVNYYHNEAHKVNDLDSMLFSALKEEEYLAMEIKDKFKPLDKGIAYDNGELFDVTWQSVKGGDDDKENISKGTLVIHLRGAFRRIRETAKKGSNAPTKFMPSDFSCVKGTPFAESREKNQKDLEKGKEIIEEQIKKSRAAQQEENDELTKLAEEEKKQEEKVKKKGKAISSQPAKEKVDEESENPTNDFLNHLLKNAPIVEATPVKEVDEEKPTKSKDTSSELPPVDELMPAENQEKPVTDSKYVSDTESFELDGTIEKPVEKVVEKKTATKPQTNNNTANGQNKSANKKKRKNNQQMKDAFDTEPLDIVENQVPESDQGVVVEVRETKTSKPSYFIERINSHLEKIDHRTRSERTFLSRVYLDRLRFQILSKEIDISNSDNDKKYWELKRSDILKYIPVEMQLHLLTQPVIENLYEVIHQPLTNKEEYKDQAAEIQKVIDSPIKRIRSINIMKIAQSPEIEMYKNLELMQFRANDLSRFIAQLEDRCFELQKSRCESIEFNPTPSSDKHYGVYRILATKSGVLGELGIQLKNYCAYKHKMGFKHLNDEIGRDLDLIYCVNLEASQKTVFVFFAPKRASTKYEQHKAHMRELNSKKQPDLFSDLTQANDATIDVALTADEPELDAVTPIDVPETESKEIEQTPQAIEVEEIEEIEEPKEEVVVIEEPISNLEPENSEDDNEVMDIEVSDIDDDMMPPPPTGEAIEEDSTSIEEPDLPEQSDESDDSNSKN